MFINQYWRILTVSSLILILLYMHVVDSLYRKAYSPPSFRRKCTSGTSESKGWALFSTLNINSGNRKSKAPINKILLSEIVNELMDRLSDEGFDGLIDSPDSDEHGDIEADGTEDNNSILNSVIRIYCTHSEPNFGMPWQRLRQESSTSSGFITDDHKILTNAHAVEYGSIVQVKKRQSEKKYLATVVAVGHECDLAVLTVSDDDFWTETTPLKFGQLPDLLEDVSVVGFPVGGDSISISSGVVSRIEMQEYAQASAELLAIQIDAAINPGNSGGPVVNSRNEVIGVAFQSLSESDVENIGYVVPVNVIDHFLKDVSKHGRYTGVCGLGVRLQGMDNIQLRKHYGMDERCSGVLVIAVAKLAPVSSVLKKNDIILSIDGIKIANDGTIPFREGSFNERVQLNYYFTQRFATDEVTLEVLREGTVLSLQSTLWVPQMLIPRTLLHGIHSADTSRADPSPPTMGGGNLMGGVPSYLMVGGLVMVALSREYLESEYKLDHMQQFDSWTDELKVLSMTDNYKEEPGQELVLLSQVLAHTCNIGYENSRNMILHAFNGVKVLNLKHLKSLLYAVAPAAVDVSEAASSDKLFFEFTNGMILVLDRQSALEAQHELCAQHFIPSSFSVDLSA